ncbi:Rmf/CrpP fold protein [Streptomyces sp. NPDC002446]
MGTREDSVKAVTAGREAGARGEAATVCPYPHASMLRTAWIRGCTERRPVSAQPESTDQGDRPGHVSKRPGHAPKSATVVQPQERPSGQGRHVRPDSVSERCDLLGLVGSRRRRFRLHGHVRGLADPCGNLTPSARTRRKVVRKWVVPVI